MSVREQDLNVMLSADAKETRICSGNFCVPSEVDPRTIKHQIPGIVSTFVDRRDTNTKEPLMTTTHYYGTVESGHEVSMSKLIGKYITRNAVCTFASPGHDFPGELTLSAQWHHRDKEHGTSGRDASVFGSLGVFAVGDNHPSIDFPLVNALSVSPLFLQAYGAAIVPVEETFRLPKSKEKSLTTLHVTEYTWKNNSRQYINNYVLQQHGGGGLFIETHPFPHIFTPLSPECGGGVILGRKVEDQYRFVAFQITYGYSLVIKSNVIHGDSFFHGPYAIALSETAFADSVLIKSGKPGARSIQPVRQVSATGNRFSFFGDITLNQRTAALLLKENLKSIARATDNDPIEKRREMKSFFKQLPQTMLSDLRHQSDLTQRAYDECYGILPVQPDIDPF
ncbi:hypothetical protein GH742_09080 [Legionella sp. MW5194]|uniref:hypothetical protein n=1 Tax=Legionella sp. MW5194 TaxID=2662448 RepID=UPI00193D4B71|nr:hypothetical protein [Legionella sp. MW5194]QRN04009.1 hypothetical protein GH742_09080 [Legionella sp. MW5194]